ncbi:MAG: hypothetical protein CM15mV127_010 [Caudoviricetes sp.]|nr:MAG: hypothetical protein CM15mV127_010 [Caudoviricetes sp.]
MGGNWFPPKFFAQTKPCWPSLGNIKRSEGVNFSIPGSKWNAQYKSQLQKGFGLKKKLVERDWGKRCQPQKPLYNLTFKFLKKTQTQTLVR